ncbi:MAG: hypothetical protein EU532_10970 [Promethearchaeota archaeon]|nr:MAG: hypothetical protein EU532_10970 [Candidatus Lokiarchaeota archaeon]
MYISDEQEEDKIKPIYVQVSKTIRAVIDKYKKEESRTISGIIEEAIDLYDKFYSMSPDAFAILDKYKDQYEDQSKLIEEALRLYDKQKNPEMADVLDLWIRAREERDMMLIGKTTFKQLISAAEEPRDSLKKPQRKNNAIDVILWYTRKPITRLTLKEIILAIQKMWTISNYFIRIDVEQPNEDTYYMTFIHAQDERYSRYWLGYFEVLFNYLNESKDVPFKCGFEGQAFGQTLSVTVREFYEKS